MLQKDMNYNKKTEGRGGCLNTSYHKTVHPFRNSGPVHTYPDIFNPLFFLSGFGFRPQVSGESGIRIRKFLNPLSIMEIFEYTMNRESCGR